MRMSNAQLDRSFQDSCSTSGCVLASTAESLCLPESRATSLETVSIEVNFLSAVSHAADLTSLWKIQSRLTNMFPWGQTFSHAKQ